MLLPDVLSSTPSGCTDILVSAASWLPLLLSSLTRFSVEL